MGKEYAYYVVKDRDGFYELRQTRFMGETHPHDVCAIARDAEEMAGMVDRYFRGGVDWSRVGGAPA